jgi:hypothetical protein
MSGIVVAWLAGLALAASGVIHLRVAIYPGRVSSVVIRNGRPNTTYMTEVEGNRL